jgi:phosphotransferase system HPr (HPr) family protein
VVVGKVSVANIDGWHARPASDFAKLVVTSGHRVQVSRPGLKAVPGDSVLSLLSLGVRQGEVLIIEVDGPNSVDLLNQLIALF